MHHQVANANTLVSNFLFRIGKALNTTILPESYLTVSKGGDNIVLRPNRTLLSIEQELGTNNFPVVGSPSKPRIRSSHATTPFISSKNRFSMSRISAAMTSGFRGGL